MHIVMRHKDGNKKSNYRLLLFVFFDVLTYGNAIIAEHDA